MPLLLEVELMALAGFALGMVVAYLIVLRRRATRWMREQSGDDDE